MKDPDIKKSNVRQLADLLSISDATADWGCGDLGAILTHQLSAPFDEKIAELDPSGLPTLQELEPSKRAELATLQDVLEHPEPPLEYLLCIKRFGKSQGRHEELPQEVAGVIYLAAIAVARLRCQQSISDMDATALAKRLQWALTQPFVDAKFAAMFQEMLEVVTQ